MTDLDSLDTTDLRAELDDWTARTLQWADDLAQAIEAQDFWRAVFMCHAYKQARWQVRKIKHLLKLGVA